MEIEAKFTVPDDPTYRRLRGLHNLAGFEIEAGPTVTDHDQYLDTADGRFLAAGYACRLRAEGDGYLVTLKGMGGSGGAIHRRDEREVSLDQAETDPRRWPKSPARSLAQEIAGREPLQPLLALRQERAKRTVRDGARAIAEMSVDRVEAAAGEKARAGERYYELEIELKGEGTEEDLARLAAALRDEWALAPQPRSKFERGLDALRARAGRLVSEPPAAPPGRQAGFWARVFRPFRRGGRRSPGVAQAAAISAPPTATASESGEPDGDSTGPEPLGGPWREQDQAEAMAAYERAQPVEQAGVAPSTSEQMGLRHEEGEMDAYLPGEQPWQADEEAAGNPSQPGVQPRQADAEAGAAGAAQTSESAASAGEGEELSLAPGMDVPVSGVKTDPDRQEEPSGPEPEAQEVAAQTEGNAPWREDAGTVVSPEPTLEFPAEQPASDGQEESTDGPEPAAREAVALPQGSATWTEDAATVVSPEPAFEYAAELADRPASGGEEERAAQPAQAGQEGTEGEPSFPAAAEAVQGVQPGVEESPVAPHGGPPAEAVPEPERPAEPPPVRPDDPMSEAGRHIMLVHYRKMCGNEDGTRTGDDDEALHDMRVATRRLRAAYDIFCPYFEVKAFGRFIKGLKRTGRALGDVRDLDVLIKKAKDFADARGDQDHAALEPLLDAWRGQRDDGRDKMIDYLDGGSYRRFKEELGEFLEAEGKGAVAVNPGDPTPYRVCDLVPRLVMQRYEAVRAYDPVLAGAPLGTYHQLRIACKKLRYTLEFFKGVLGDPAPKLIKRVTEMQDLLGDLHDSVVAEELVADFLSGQAHARMTEAGQPSLEGAALYLSAQWSIQRDLMARFANLWPGLVGYDFRRDLGLAVAAL